MRLTQNGAVPVLWEVHPVNTQDISRRCPHCHVKCAYRSSLSFRVNANQKLIDVWHIYKCTRCDDTWNIEVIARRNRRTIPDEMLDAYMSNDAQVAFRLSFDYGLLARNRVECAETPKVVVEGPEISEFPEASSLAVTIRSDIPIPVRLHSILAQKCGLSRSGVKRLTSTRAIFLDDRTELRNRLRGLEVVYIDPRRFLGCSS